MELTFPLPVGDMFMIEIAEGSNFAEKWKETPIYQIVNTESGLVEGESFSLARAILQARASEMSIHRLLDDTPSDMELMAVEHGLDALEDNDPDLKPH